MARTPTPFTRCADAKRRRLNPPDRSPRLVVAVGPPGSGRRLHEVLGPNGPHNRWQRVPQGVPEDERPGWALEHLTQRRSVVVELVPVAGPEAVGHEWVELAAALHCPCAAVVFPPSDEVSPSHSSSGPRRPPLADGFSVVHDVASESDLIRVAGMIRDHPPPAPDTDNQISASSEEPPCPPTRSLTESPSPPPPPGSQGPPWAVAFAALFRLVVLDLDDTLWQGDCVSLNRGPYALTNPTECVDTSGRSLRLIPEVPTILAALRAAGCTLAVASQCPVPPTARTLLALFGLSEYFPPDLVVILRSPKDVHLQIQARSGVPFGRTAFFDDRIPNVTVARRLGVTAVRVHAGLSVESVRTASRDQRSVTGARGRLRRWLSLS